MEDWTVAVRFTGPCCTEGPCGVALTCEELELSPHELTAETLVVERLML